MKKDNITQYIHDRIATLNDELIKTVEDARISKALYKELESLYNKAVDEEDHDQSEVMDIIEKIQKCYNDNQDARMKHKEIQAVIKELKGLVKDE